MSFDPNTDCSCILEVEHELIKNDNLTGVVGQYRVKKIIRHLDKRCREHTKGE